MATNLDEICKFLDEANLRYDRRENDVITGFGTKRYQDSDGENGILVVILPSENGEYLEIFCPGAYKCGQTPHKATVLQALLMVSWRTKLVQFEYDDTDGEIRPKVEFPLEDASLTKLQLFRCIQGIAQIVDQFDPVIRGAMDRGVIEWPPEIEASQTFARALAGGEGADDLMREFARFLAARGRGAGDPSGDGKGGDVGLED
ncbi:MAG: YbjN domain-containing protein [Verrucomicrobiales bacterium]|nr:YbjN domain-containing protein [Verrucomicrobiales bacterium]